MSVASYGKHDSEMFVHLLASRRGRDSPVSSPELAFACVGLNASDHIRGDPALARGPRGHRFRCEIRVVGATHLKWRPTLTFDELVRRIFDAGLRALG